MNEKISLERKIAEKLDSYLFEKGVPNFVVSKNKFKNPKIDMVLTVIAFMLLVLLFIFVFLIIVVG